MYYYRQQQKKLAEQQTRRNVNIITGVVIVALAILCNIIAELPLYQQLIVALS